MKILAIGDLIGNAGIQELSKRLPKIRKDKNIDFVIVNGENSAEGMGMTEKNFKDILAQNINVITDRKSTRLNSSHTDSSRMPSSA